MKLFLLTALSSLLFFQAFTQVNLNQGLIAYYPFNGNATDASGNNNTPTFNNATLTTDRLGNANQAYQFDGIDDHMTIPGNAGMNTANAMSVCMYFNPESTSLQTLIGKISYSAGNGTQFQIALNFNLFPGVLFGVNNPADDCAAQVVLNSSYVNTGGTGALPTNQWYCLAATFAQGVQKIYLNGMLISTTNAPFTTLKQCTNSDIQLGTWWANDQQRFKGRIDDVRIYNRALNQSEVTALCTTCSNWLQLSSQPAYVNIGDLDVPGDKITVEAQINRTTPYTGGLLYAGDVVSKHTGPNDANYLLRPNHAEITTSNGYFRTPDICEIELNRTYHVAMVYDGATLKFYRDGFLMSQVAATGNLFQTNLPARVGLYAANTLPTQFVGYINEVRIWNVARSQAEIRSNMNSSLPTPGIQPGLQAYYTFDNLINKQGNVTWNATLTGNATINATNPNCAFTPDSCKNVTAHFTTPDTVCVNTPVTITNNSLGASSYYWNFCVGNLNTPPAAVNIGNPNGLLSGPVFMDYAYDNGKYYGFAVNFSTGRLVRLDYGNSLLNPPFAVNLGNYGGLLQNNDCEGIQVVQNEGKWYALIVGGRTPKIIKIDFGANIESPGVPTNWGNIGNLNQPIDLHVFKEGTNWYGFTVNAEGNTITRFNFTNSFDNTPTAINLGNVGGLMYPTGIYAINDNGFWRVFITNGGDNQRIGTLSSLTRIDFGTSLLNMPTGVNLGNPGGGLKHPRDFTIMKFCGQIIGFAVNGNPNANDLVRLNFGNDLTTPPTATSLGNTGNLNFPHSLSKLFRVNDDVYAFITNVANNTITRLRFQGCTNASVSSSTDQNPVPVTYNTPGTYNINLTVDDGLATQAAYCKQVVVMAPPTHTPTQNITICSGNNVKIGTGVKYARYTWNTGANTDSIIVNTPGNYWVQTDRFGCSNIDTINVTISPCTPPTAQFTAPDTVCVNTPVTITNTSSGASSYYWNFCTGNLNAPPTGANLGNIGGAMTSPVYIDYVQENGNYYGFVTDNYTGGLFRLDFGASLLNAPSLVNLGTVGGVIPATVEGIQVIKNEGKWYAIIVGGDPVGGIASRIIKVEFGANITNNSPTATNWGNIGNLNYPHDLYVFSDNNGIWYGLTVNTGNNTITRFNFTNSFSNTPTAINLGNLGALNGPTGIHAINDNGNWYAFVTNALSNTLTRLDFGNSLLNTPTGVNLGNPGGVFHTCWDIYIIKYCGDLLGYVINADQNYNDIIKLNFNNNITSTPTAVSFGNIGNLRFPHCLSKIFRAGADLYTLIPNVGNQTLSRLSFTGCTNASLPNSTDQNPAPVTYNTPGTYNINLTIDDGLATQTAFCKQVVVLPAPTHTPTQAINICTGNNIKIGTGVKYAKYTWNTSATTDSIIVNTAGTYWVQTDRYGCSNKDSMIVSVLADPVVNLGADTAVCNFNNFVLDAGNAGATFLWQNGSAGQTFTATGYGKYYVRVTNASGCVSSDTIIIDQAFKIAADFQYKQDICNPLSVQFVGVGANLQNPYWAFGDGNTSTGNFNTANTYPAYGNYTVKFGIESGVCKDTITKVISINVTTGNLILTPDTTICFNTTKQLRTQPALSFCWSPTTYLDNPAVQNPVTSTPGKITYYFTAEVTGNNIITNGDFSNGNTGFTSQYNFANPNMTEREYSVGGLPQLWNPLLGACRDHTTGAGNMLLVNGAPTANTKVWSATIAVTPNTNYAFSAWLQNLNVHGMASNPARLQFSINGNPLGNIFQSNIANCIWEQFYTVWNSGNNTTASISVVNQNTVASGNDFALDDISFAPVFIQRDSVIISVDTAVVRANNDTTICKGAQVQLQASGAATWLWTPSAGLTNKTIPNPRATPAGTTDYIVTGTTLNGCVAKDTVAVTMFPIPTVINDHDVETCPGMPAQLTANSALVSFAWTPAATLNNPAIANPMASPAANTVYTVQVTDANNCNYSDTVSVHVRIIDFAALGNNAGICRGESVTLKALGGSTYQWSPAGSLDDATTATPTATPDTSTLYSVYIRENNCNRDTTIQVRVTVNPSPTVIAEKTNDLDCATHSTQLNAFGSTGNAYVWLPASGLDHPTMPNPVCSTDTTITYWVTGTNQYGCATMDSVTVYVTTTGKVTFMVPNAFTPNGDGRNDCFGVKSWGGADIEEFSVFNRWGERVFSSNNATACWDGRFKGELQPSGGYVYVIKAKTYCGHIKRTGTLVLVR